MLKILNIYLKLKELLSVMNDSLKIALLKLRIICEGLKKAFDEVNKELKHDDKRNRNAFKK